MGDDSRESLAQQHRLVSARRSGGTREGALLIGRMAWSLSLGIVNCGWLHIYFHFQDQISRILTPCHHYKARPGLGSRRAQTVVSIASFTIDMSDKRGTVMGSCRWGNVHQNK